MLSSTNLSCFRMGTFVKCSTRISRWTSLPRLWHGVESCGGCVAYRYGWMLALDLSNLVVVHWSSHQVCDLQPNHHWCKARRRGYIHFKHAVQCGAGPTHANNAWLVIVWLPVPGAWRSQNGESGPPSCDRGGLDAWWRFDLNPSPCWPPSQHSRSHYQWHVLIIFSCGMNCSGIGPTCAYTPNRDQGGQPLSKYLLLNLA